MRAVDRNQGKGWKINRLIISEKARKKEKNQKIENNLEASSFAEMGYVLVCSCGLREDLETNNSPSKSALLMKYLTVDTRHGILSIDYRCADCRF